MRRLILILLCIFLLTGAVSAVSQATSIQSAASVNADGSCQVTVIASVHLDQGDSALTFPLPLNAKNIKLNNTAARVFPDDTAMQVSLEKFTGGSAGDFTLTFSYTLDQILHNEEEIGQVMTMPILCGFAYPIERLDFSITLPGTFDASPTFSSGYHQQSIESNISYMINGATITGTLSQRLQDHETLTMRLQIPEGLFSASAVTVYEVSPYRLTMLALAGLALIYWLLTLRTMPLRRIACSMPPEGITAGDLGSRLCMQGADLTMMVLSWAQMGYLTITLDRHDHVLLHQRMTMGNERSPFENHYFHALFRKTRVVDGTGYRYAQLCCKASAERSAGRSGFRPHSGNPQIFRALCAMSGAAAGASLGGALIPAQPWHTVVSVLLGIAALAASWMLQTPFQYLYLRRRSKLARPIAAAAVWLILGLLSGQIVLTLGAICLQLAGGFLAACGGRRTDLGRQTASEILGLRRYLKTVSAEQLQRITAGNPDYYYELAPYALALGVDQAFATRFAAQPLPRCAYLLTQQTAGRTAADWYPVLRRTVDLLNARPDHMKRNRFLR